MRRKDGQPTSREVRFAEVYAMTNHAPAAAAAAGYAKPEIAGYALAERPIIKKMTRAVLEDFLRDRAGQIGVAVLIELAESESTPASTRRAAAKDLTELSGTGVNVNGSKDLYDMSGDELQAAILLAKGRLVAAEHLAAERSQPIIDGNATVVQADGDLFD